MASHLPPPPPPPPTPTTPTSTSITGLSDDLLREIFLRLPALPSLVCAAFACRAFRRAVRSSPAFRRSFRELHAPPLLAFFLQPNFEVVPSSSFPWRRSDPDLAAADFFGVRLSRHPTGWEIQSHNPSADGYLILDKGTLPNTTRRAAYNPLTQALDLYIFFYDLQLYTLPSEDGQVPSRVVCVIRQPRRSKRAAVFSADTMKWRFFPKDTLPPRHSARIGRAMRGHIWWPNWMHGQIGVLDTATFQFYLIDLPTSSTTDEHTYKIGETKDEKLCIVDIKDNKLVSHFLTAGHDDSVVEGWVLYNEFPLHPIVQEFTGCSMDEEGSCVKLVAVIDGFVYLSIMYCKDKESCELYLSLCLETSETSELFKGAYRHNEDAHPYVMAWPPSLLQSKEESEAELDDGPVGTKQGPSVLVAALQSLSQALMDDGDSNREIVAQLDAFLRPNVVDEGSLVSKITSLDSQLVTARDRILRISA
uniref:Uncharacterized protein n=1 Tax=Avena sativa TaxID=4498 RepID=A0ACD6A8E7_AVESA